MATTDGDEKKEGSVDRSRRRDNDDGDRRDSKRRRKHRDDNSISSDDSSSYERSRRKRKKKVKKRKHKKHSKRSSRDLSSDDETSHSSSDEGSGDRRKKRKHKHHHKSSRRRRDDSSSSDEDRRRNKKSKKKDKNRKKEKKEDEDNGLPTFGKYGILKLADMPQKERSFNIWMEEIKGVPSFSGPKWELQNYYKEYMEDFNTATLPHKKYYDYDKWEMEEYKKQMAGLQEGTSAQQDEARHYQEMRDRAKSKHEEDLAMVKSMMSKEKVEEMKHKAQMQTEMAHAFKMGDQETFQRLKRRLEPEQK